MGQTSRLAIAETTYQHPSTSPVSRRAAISQARLKHMILPADSETDPDLTVTARVDHGRWIVDCPICAGAQIASLDDPRFLCADCFNRAIGGRMMAIVWPDEREQIEAELVKRTNAENRNWRSGETVDDLIGEREAVEAGAQPVVMPSDHEVLAALIARVDALEAAINKTGALKVAQDIRR